MDRRSPELVKQLKYEVINRTNRFKTILCYFVHNTVNVMMKTRGYDTMYKGIDLSNITLNQFKELYKGREAMEHEYISGKDKLLVMYLQYSTKFGTEEMRDIVSYIYNANVMKVIVITELPPTSQAYNNIDIIKPINIEFYCYTDLVHNIIYHASLYRDYSIIHGSSSEEGMKTISVSDPLSKYLGASIGDVVKTDTMLRKVIQ